MGEEKRSACRKVTSAYRMHHEDQKLLRFIKKVPFFSVPCEGYVTSLYQTGRSQRDCWMYRDYGFTEKRNVRSEAVLPTTHTKVACGPPLYQPLFVINFVVSSTPSHTEALAGAERTMHAEKPL